MDESHGSKRLGWLVHLVYGLLIFGILAGTLYGYLNFVVPAHKVELEKVSQEAKQAQDSLKTFIDREVRWENMKKTLIINFGLTKYEARYYSIMFDDFSLEYDIPWEIYPALVRIESNFRTTLKSDKGAKGLTQVLESTAKEQAKKLEIPYKESETLWNEILNMTIGLTYLSDGIVELMGEEDKDKAIEHGVKRYLGGPGYAKTAKRNRTMYAYIGSYRTSVWEEYQRLQYIYKGVIADEIPLSDMSVPPDSLMVDSLFVDE